MATSLFSRVKTLVSVAITAWAAIYLRTVLSKIVVKEGTLAR